MENKQKAFSFAVECLRPYIERGDTYEHTAHGQMGVYCGDNEMFIGGYLKDKKLTCHQVGVSRVSGQDVEFVFSLKEIFDYVLNPSKQLSLFS